MRDDLDPLILSVLEKQIVKHNGSLMMKVGDTRIPYDENFQLILTTRLSSPKIQWDSLVGKLTVIDFELSPNAFKDQILALLINKERPDLAEMKSQVNLILSHRKIILFIIKLL